MFVAEQSLREAVGCQGGRQRYAYGALLELVDGTLASHVLHVRALGAQKQASD
jgi:hypothetical protein